VSRGEFQLVSILPSFRDFVGAPFYVSAAAMKSRELSLYPCDRMKDASPSLPFGPARPFLELGEEYR
jgi:hypothetical protein